MSNPHTVITVKCANCEKVKQSCNHWFVVRTMGSTFVCYPFDKVGLIDDMRPVCGQGCAQAELEIWMTKVRNAESVDIGEVRRREA